MSLRNVLLHGLEADMSLQPYLQSQTIEEDQNFRASKSGNADSYAFSEVGY